MIKIYFVLTLLILLSSCSTAHLSYYGRSSTPTKQADIYLYEEDLSIPYEVLGRAEISKSAFVSNTSDRVKKTAAYRSKRSRCRCCHLV